MMPVWLLRALPYLAAVGVFVLVLSLAYNAGSRHTAAKYELQLSQEREANQQAIAAEMLARREQEQAAAADAEAKDAKYREDQKNAKADFDKRVADISAQRVRVTIPIVSCRPAGANAGAGNREARAELDPATAGRLAGIADDGDSAIRELNLCVDKYNAVRDRFNSRTGERPQ